MFFLDVGIFPHASQLHESCGAVVRPTLYPILQYPESYAILLSKTSGFPQMQTLSYVTLLLTLQILWVKSPGNIVFKKKVQQWKHLWLKEIFIPFVYIYTGKTVRDYSLKIYRCRLFCSNFVFLTFSLRLDKLIWNLQWNFIMRIFISGLSFINIDQQ